MRAHPRVERKNVLTEKLVLVAGRTLCAASLFVMAVADGTYSAFADDTASETVQLPVITSIGLETGVSKEVIFPTPPKSIIIGDPNIADILLVGEKTGVLFPKRIGVTRMVAFDKAGKLIGSYDLPVGAPTTISVWRDGSPSRLWCNETSCLSDIDIAQKNSVSAGATAQQTGITINTSGQTTTITQSATQPSGSSSILNSKTVTKTTTTAQPQSGE